ncbi:TolC family protein [Nitrosococcus watsonii]|uniref:TolC family protein n=1 Tax=Nitrosococcus watsonii TaxID=473531 RepID=UPI001E4E6B2D|nr:TolC family protein [Nitrosococcus watsonii]
MLFIFTSCASHNLPSLGGQPGQSAPFEPENGTTAASPQRTGERKPLFGGVSSLEPVLTGGEALSLSKLEALARQHNPTLAQAKAQIQSEHAKALEAGLYPNPVIGYIGEQINVRGTAGEFQGGFIRQEIVTAGKLRLSREKYQARASAAELLALAQMYRVINGVRMQFYRTLGAERKLEVQQELLETAEDRQVTVQEMFNVGQANRADLHQTRVLRQAQLLNVQQAENDLAMERETLGAIIGLLQPLGEVTGKLEAPLQPLVWEEALERLLAESPELAAAHANLKADEIMVQREKVEPIPNLFIEGSAGRNFEASETVYGVRAFVEVPLFDWNQGTIRQAKADWRRQRNEVRRTELSLRQSLADWFRRFRTALQKVTEYQNVILPQSEQRYVTRLKSYRADRETWSGVLEAQHDFFHRRLIYIDQLVAWRQAQVAIDGFLLVGGLEPPAGVVPPGHIDSVPKPR